MKYADWLKLWVHNYIKPSAKERTFVRYKQLIRTHIAPKISDSDVKQLYAGIGIVRMDVAGQLNFYKRINKSSNRRRVYVGGTFHIAV